MHAGQSDMPTTEQRVEEPTVQRPRLWRRIVRDAAVIILIAGVVLGIALFRGPNQAHLLYYQYRLAHLELPPNAVMYQFSPAVVLTENPLPLFDVSAAMEAAPAKPDYATTDGDDDNCEILPAHVIPFGGAGDPAIVDQFNRYMKYILTDDFQVLYAHRHTINGQSRLVIVQFGANTRKLLPRPFLEVIVLEPATFSNVPRQLSRQRFATPTLNVPFAPTTFFAGQTDAANPAAFSLAFEQHGRRHTLAGALTPDARHVSFQPAD